MRSKIQLVSMPEILEISCLVSRLCGISSGIVRGKISRGKREPELRLLPDQIIMLTYLIHVVDMQHAQNQRPMM